MDYQSSLLQLRSTALESWVAHVGGACGYPPLTWNMRIYNITTPLASVSGVFYTGARKAQNSNYFSTGGLRYGYLLNDPQYT